MPTIELNLAAVIVAAVVNMVIGFAWYSRFLFGTKWIQLMGWDSNKMPDMKKGMQKVMALSFLGALVMAFVLDYFVRQTESLSVSDAIRLGFLLWLGFIATTMLSEVLYEKKSIGLYLINSGYSAVALVVMTIILTVWA